MSNYFVYHSIHMLLLFVCSFLQVHELLRKGFRQNNVHSWCLDLWNEELSPLQTRLLQTGPTWTGGLMSWYLFRNAVSLYWVLRRLISYLKWWKTQGGPEIEQKVQLDLPFKMKYSHEWNLFWVTIKKHDFMIICSSFIQVNGNDESSSKSIFSFFVVVLQSVHFLLCKVLF